MGDAAILAIDLVTSHRRQPAEDPSLRLQPVLQHPSAADRDSPRHVHHSHWLLASNERLE